MRIFRFEFMLIIEYCKNKKKLYSSFSRIVIKAISAALNRNKTPVIGLSGGKTPRAFYSDLAKATNYKKYDGINFNRIRFFLGDERDVALDSSESNYANALASLCGGSKILRSSIAPLNFNFKCPAATASDYACRIFNETGPGGEFDLLILGMGSDGHTASLFTRTVYDLTDFSARAGSSLTCGENLFVSHYVPSISAIRYTLTPYAIYKARSIILLVTGHEKRKLLIDSIEGRLPVSELPAVSIFKNRSGPGLDAYVITDIDIS